jgi:hypothetical protein
MKACKLVYSLQRLAIAGPKAMQVRIMKKGMLRGEHGRTKMLPDIFLAC